MSITLNNSKNKALGISPNEYVTGAKAREILDMVNSRKPEPCREDMLLDRETFRQEAADAVVWVNTKAKIWYDRKHKPLMMRVGDKAWVRLHHGYGLPGLTGRKFS